MIEELTCLNNFIECSTTAIKISFIPSVVCVLIALWYDNKFGYGKGCFFPSEVEK